MKSASEVFFLCIAPVWSGHTSMVGLPVLGRTEYDRCIQVELSPKSKVHNRISEVQNRTATGII